MEPIWLGSLIQKRKFLSIINQFNYPGDNGEKTDASSMSHIIINFQLP